MCNIETFYNEYKIDFVAVKINEACGDLFKKLSKALSNLIELLAPFLGGLCKKI